MCQLAGIENVQAALNPNMSLAYHMAPTVVGRAKHAYAAFRQRHGGLAPKLAPEFALLIVEDASIEGLGDTAVRERIRLALRQCLESFNAMLGTAVRKAPLIYGRSEHIDPKLRLVIVKAPVASTLAAGIAAQLGLPISYILAKPHIPDFMMKAQSDGISTVIFPEPASEIQESFSGTAQQQTSLALTDAVLFISDDLKFDATRDEARALFRSAILLRRPIIWIDGGARVRIIRLEAVDEAVHRAVKAGALSPQELAPLFVDSSDFLLNAEALRIADPFEAAKQQLIGPDDLSDLQSYFSNSTPPRNLGSLAGRLDRAFTAMCTGRPFWRELLRDASAPWFGVTSVEAGLDKSFLHEPHGIAERFYWSDRMANMAAGFHRDTTFILYMFSALAVASAISGAVGFWPGAHSSFWPCVELSLILTIFLIFKLSKKARWHHRWMSHRFIAEQLRYARAGLPFCSFQSPVMNSPYILSGIVGEFRQFVLQSAEQWLLRRTFVAAGMPNSNNGSVLDISQHGSESANYLKAIINGQISYHKTTQSKCHRLSHALHQGTTIAFGVSAIAVIGHFILHADWLLIFTAALPALAAALHGIGTQNELRRLELLSASTVRALTEILAAFEHLPPASSANDTSWINMRRLAAEALKVMSNVNEQWEDLIRERGTNLPA